MSTRDERITIGEILRPKGLRGELKVLPLTDIPNRFSELSHVIVALPNGQDVTVEVAASREYHGYAYIRFAHRDSRESAEELVGGLIQVERASVPELPDDVYYHFEILDAEVVTDDGKRLGTVVDIMETGAHDVYVVQGNEREYLIPANKETVRHIDRQQGTITIHPLEGLLDL
jgi:16S rRNA processing protein RimM